MLGLSQRPIFGITLPDPPFVIEQPPVMPATPMHGQQTLSLEDGLPMLPREPCVMPEGRVKPTTAERPRGRGWTRHPDVADMLQRGVQRFISLYPWSATGASFHPEFDLCFVMLTAAELLWLHPLIPTSMPPTCGHNDAPCWEECARYASAYPEMLFAGFLMPPSRADEGVDLDAVYVPQPDPDDAIYLQVITPPDGALHTPDEDGIEQINGRSYRRLWWDWRGQIGMDPYTAMSLKSTRRKE